MNSHMQETTTQPYHGIYINDGRKYSNWGLSRSTQPAVYVEPISYADVQAIVRDIKQFPTPVHLVGSMLSVSETVVGDTKESSLDEPGYFSSHVLAITYVDEHGVGGKSIADPNSVAAT